MPRHGQSPILTRPEAETLALSALGWVLGDADRAERLLALTGLTPEQMRASLTDPAMLSAVLEFLGRYEPDLVKAAEALQIAPETLIAAQEILSR
ncbi:DUF3572 domain-containing protein [Qipengyuania sp. RS5-5]|uniref:DUF3572 domain-containing protein n=1 Tax=Parerythrobacter lacustris TaxID=2969984 RepID=A0ABT1XTK0_9SPHN|nr:DUF3572 domain-containing protein [Parerythrobacter lacustris]